MTGLIDYRYDECGLDNVILKNFRVCTDDAGEEVVTIPNVNLLHKVLTCVVASKPSGLQPKEIRFLRTELGLTQAQLAALVGRDAQTIGRWERGETAPEQSHEMVIRMRALEQLGEAELPSIEELARRTVKSSVEPPFLIDARDPAHYRPMDAEPIAA
ncbi:MAG: helix-turn-helix domain-containing protein [Phenylobacterium sp.]